MNYEDMEERTDEEEILKFEKLLLINKEIDRRKERIKERWTETWMKHRKTAKRQKEKQTLHKDKQTDKI